MDAAKVGLAVLSSVSSLTTIQYPSSLDEFRPVLGPAWRTAHVSLRIGEAVRARGYDKVVIFNGRHCYSRPFCDILEGEAEVTVDGELRNTMRQGDFFGEISMLDQGEGTATIVTTARCRLMVMSHAQFRDVVKSHDGILVKVLEAMARRLRSDLDIARTETRMASG